MRVKQGIECKHCKLKSWSFDKCCSFSPHNNLSENDIEIDELISEIRKLREANGVMKETLKSIASFNRPRHDSEDYWKRLKKEQCALVLATDTKLARNAFNEAAKIMGDE